MSKKNKNAAPATDAAPATTDTTTDATTTVTPATPKKVGRKPYTETQKADSLTRRTLPALTESEVFYDPVLWAGLPVAVVARLEVTLAGVKAMRLAKKAELEKALAEFNEVAPQAATAEAAPATVNA